METILSELREKIRKTEHEIMILTQQVDRFAASDYTEHRKQLLTVKSKQLELLKEARLAIVDHEKLNGLL